jgi:hypothetical protein
MASRKKIALTASMATLTLSLFTGTAAAVAATLWGNKAYYNLY